MKRQIIKQAIKDAGSQTKLAKKLNLSQSVVSKWLTGSPEINLSSAIMLAKVTGHTLEQIADDFYN
jgi:ribosome-binding protein aMBF1 (putative translation factor)